MNYTKLSNSELFIKTKIAAQNEKAATLILLEYLNEVDRRKLYAEKAYGTLFDYVVNELGYSESQAADRVNTVRLMQSVPDVKKHLEMGELTLTSASQIQRFIRAESKAAHLLGERYAVAVPQELKEEAVRACLNHSKRDVEKILLSKMSEPGRVILEEKVRAVTNERSELKFTVSAQVLKKLEHIQNLIGNESLERIFDQSLDALIAKEEKKKGVSVTSAEKSTWPAKWKSGSSKQTSPPASLAAKASTASNSRYIPMDWKRKLYDRSKGQCEFISKVGQRCKVRFQLQVDHIRPLALGGKTELSNLRHLCMQHNQSAALKSGILLKPSFSREAVPRVGD